MSNTLGIIIGHGYAKAYSDVCKMTRFPAVAAPAALAGYSDAVTGHGPSLVHLNNSGQWLVGEEAQAFAPARLVSILDKARYGDPSFIAMARYAIAQTIGEGSLDSLMSGMPAAWFDDLTARETLEMALRTAAAPWGAPPIKLAPEAAGVFYSHVFESGRMDTNRAKAATGVIDIGYRDTNIAFFSQGRYAGGRSVAGGLVAALREIKRLITRTYGLELSEHEVDQAVRRGSVRIAGEDRPLPLGSSEELRAGLSSLLGTARSIWPSGGRTLDAIVLGGGGAVVLGPALRQEFPQLVVPHAPSLRSRSATWSSAIIADADPQMAGVRGFAAAAAASLQAVTR